MLILSTSYIVQLILTKFNKIEIFFSKDILTDTPGQFSWAREQREDQRLLTILMPTSLLLEERLELCCGRAPTSITSHTLRKDNLIQVFTCLLWLKVVFTDKGLYPEVKKQENQDPDLLNPEYHSLSLSHPSRSLWYPRPMADGDQLCLHTPHSLSDNSQHQCSVISFIFVHFAQETRVKTLEHRQRN